MNTLFGCILDFYANAWGHLQKCTKIVQNSIQLKTDTILSNAFPKTKGSVKPFLGRRTPSYHGAHQVIFYDFDQHHVISQGDWNKGMGNNLNSQMNSISQNIVGSTQEIGESLKKYINQFIGYTYQYTSHLLNPLYQESHYTQFKRKHIGIQGKEDNIIFAFSFSPEEMSLYRNIDHLNHSWKEEKERWVTSLKYLISLAEEVSIDYEKIRLFESNNNDYDENEGWGKATKSEILNFISILELFDPENYMLLEREALEETHKGIEKVLGI